MLQQMAIGYAGPTTMLELRSIQLQPTNIAFIPLLFVEQSALRRLALVCCNFSPEQTNMALGIDFVQVGWEFLLPGKCDIVQC
jgi:hypothetical protein